MKSTIFWDIIPCSPLNVNRRFRGKRNQGESRWQAEQAICSSQTSVDFQRSTLRYIPEDSTLQKNNIIRLIQQVHQGMEVGGTLSIYHGSEVAQNSSLAQCLSVGGSNRDSKEGKDENNMGKV
jgi:hypothetical protein